MTKIDIISGFLGAGKTTLIKKLLSEAFQGEKVVLIENEFGEIGIDGGFLKDAGIEITEMNSGCICCSLVGDFGTALKEVIERYHPERVIIEPSGVGKLSDVIKAVQNVQDGTDMVLNSFTTVADANKCKMYMKNFGEFYNNQVENAGTIILSRTGNIKEEKLEKAVELLREKNKDAAIITTPWEELDGKQILQTMERNDSFMQDLLKEVEVCPECGHVHEHHHDHDHESCGCGHDHHEHHHNHDHEGCGCGHDVAVDTTITSIIITTIMKVVAVDMIITSIIMTTTMKVVAVDTIIMNIIMTMKAVAVDMTITSIIMTTIMKVVAVDMTITMIIIMQMRCLQVGEQRHLRSLNVLM